MPERTVAPDARPQTHLTVPPLHGTPPFDYGSAPKESRRRRVVQKSAFGESFFSLPP